MRFVRGWSVASRARVTPPMRRHPRHFGIGTSSKRQVLSSRVNDGSRSGQALGAPMLRGLDSQEVPIDGLVGHPRRRRSAPFG